MCRSRGFRRPVDTTSTSQPSRSRSSSVRCKMSNSELPASKSTRKSTSLPAVLCLAHASEDSDVHGVMAAGDLHDLIPALVKEVAEVGADIGDRQHVLGHASSYRPSLRRTALRRGRECLPSRGYPARFLKPPPDQGSRRSGSGGFFRVGLPLDRIPRLGSIPRPSRATCATCGWSSRSASLVALA